MRERRHRGVSLPLFASERRRDDLFLSSHDRLSGLLKFILAWHLGLLEACFFSADRVVMGGEASVRFWSGLSCSLDALHHDRDGEKVLMELVASMRIFRRTGRTSCIRPLFIVHAGAATLWDVMRVKLRLLYRRFSRIDRCCRECLLRSRGDFKDSLNHLGRTTRVDFMSSLFSRARERTRDHFDRASCGSFCEDIHLREPANGVFPHHSNLYQ
jgi:hypothetical protein